VATGVTGVGDGVHVGVLVVVSVGRGVMEGAAEGRITCVAAGAQAFRRRIITKSGKFFIVRLDEYQSSNEC